MTAPHELLAQGVSALRDGDAARATALLAAATEAIAVDPSLADVLIAARSIYAQALLAAGRPAEADPVIRAAIGALRRLTEVPTTERAEALAGLRAVQDRVTRALADAAAHEARVEAAAHIAATPIEDLLSAATTASERAALLVQKAVAAAASGDLDTSADLAFSALDVAAAAADTEWQVLARAALMRADPERAEHHLSAGLALAADAAEFNLVSTLAHAAEAAGVPMPVEHGPHRST